MLFLIVIWLLHASGRTQTGNFREVLCRIQVDESKQEARGEQTSNVATTFLQLEISAYREIKAQPI
jgi:hypothetical protein